MYAVIKTGGKQYRVQAGDLLVVEKLQGEPGAEIAFDEVLMIGEGAAVTVGKPTVAGASVKATLVETRKGEKIKVFKKIRRQGYRRTRGHRQFQSVLRVTGIEGDGKSETWDGTVDLTPLAVLNARARNLARGMEAAEARRSAEESVKAAKASAPAKPAKAKAVKTKDSGAKAPEARRPREDPVQAEEGRGDRQGRSEDEEDGGSRQGDPGQGRSQAQGGEAKAAAERPSHQDGGQETLRQERLGSRLTRNRAVRRATAAIRLASAWASRNSAARRCWPAISSSASASPISGRATMSAWGAITPSSPRRPAR